MLNFIFSTTGDTAAKIWATNPGQKWLWITIGINIFTGLTFMLVVREGGLAVGSTIALLLTILSTVLIGFLIFKETVALGQWLGIGLGLIAIPLILGVIKFST